MSQSNVDLIVDALTRETLSDFTLLSPLGEGSFATVIKAQAKDQPYPVAVKIMNKRHLVKHEKAHIAQVEKDALARLRGHPYFISLLATFQDAQNLYFVLDYAEEGDLFGFIQQYGTVDESGVRFYGSQLFCALEHLEKCHVLHRDIKPENILLTHQRQLKLADFGSAKVQKSNSDVGEINSGADLNADCSPEKDTARSPSFVGSADYVAPEILSGKQASASSDLWSAAGVLFYLMVGKSPFRGANDYWTFQNITQIKYQLPPSCGPSLRNLFEGIWRIDNRLSLSDVMASAWLQSVDWDCVRTGNIASMPPPTHTPKQSDSEQSIAANVPDSVEQGQQIMFESLAKKYRYAFSPISHQRRLRLTATDLIYSVPESNEVRGTILLSDILHVDPWRETGFVVDTASGRKYYFLAEADSALEWITRLSNCLCQK